MTSSGSDPGVIKAVRSEGPLIICDFNSFFFQIASIKPFSLVPQSPSYKKPKIGSCFCFHYDRVSIVVSMYCYMHTWQFNSMECLKNELQCCDCPDPGFEALKQSENEKKKNKKITQTLGKCQICIPTRTGQPWGREAELVPCTSARKHQVVCECKIRPIQLFYVSYLLNRPLGRQFSETHEKKIKAVSLCPSFTLQSSPSEEE